MSFSCFKWYLQESNQGHTDFQSVALPTELRYLTTLRTAYLFQGGCKYNFYYRIIKQKRKKGREMMEVQYF